MEVPTIALPGGISMPVLGQGTWRMGEARFRRQEEVAALQLGIDLGMTLVDTAELYSDAEQVVGEAIQGRRDRVFLVSKVLPSHASRAGTIQAAEGSLARLGTDYMDLYLLHWEGNHPLEDTFAGFLDLQAQGKIRAFGVSNFDADQLARARRGPGGDRIAANQILYNLIRRDPEHRILPACREAGIAVMAYAPFEQGILAPRAAPGDEPGAPDGDALARVARRHQATPAQIAIAWTLRRPGMVSIPKAVTPAHLRENAAAVHIRLSEQDLAELDRAFPAPGDGEALASP